MTNIAEILRNAPKGLKLYSPLYGEVELMEINAVGNIAVKKVGTNLFLKDGRYFDYPNAECLLFPSKEHRTWDDWQNVLLKMGDIVYHESPLESYRGVGIFKGGRFGINNDGSKQKFSFGELRYATPEEREQFFKDLESNGYRWNQEKGELEETSHKPKFKVGDWLVHEMDDGRISIPRQIVGKSYKSYVFDDDACFYISDAEDAFRKWTIQDAKEGDVLVGNICGTIIVYDNNEYDCKSYCRYVRGQFVEHPESGWDSNAFSPATKEQKETLFKAMEDAGYEWDAENMVVKPISQPQEEYIHSDIPSDDKQSEDYYVMVKYDSIDAIFQRLEAIVQDLDEIKVKLNSMSVFTIKENKPWNIPQPPITVLYGCPIPDTMYKDNTNTITDNGQSWTASTKKEED